MWVLKIHPAEVLPDDVLGPAITKRFVTQFERVLQIQKRDHEPHIKAWSARCAHTASDEDATAREIKQIRHQALLQHALARRTLPNRCELGLDLHPR